jgi:succinylglutamate desuccinylase
VLDDSLPNRRFALSFPVPLVLGLEEELQGTMVFHWTAQGITCVAFEGGQHDDPRSVDRSEAAFWIALEAAALLPALGARRRGSRAAA